MDPKVWDESLKHASNFMCEKNLNTIDKSIVCPTPEKKAEPLPFKFKETLIQLPEKYRTIADLFSHMSCSLRLLHLRKKTPTFQNVCNKVEVLAKRNFSYAHLAQMKYILPEGIEIEKVIVLDKKSLCMRPDLKITLVFEAVKDHSEQSADMALGRYFNSRLINFFNMHPEGIDIPEATLPEPFSQRDCNLISEDVPVNSSTELSSTSNQIEPLLNNSYLYPSLRRPFSQKNVANQTEQVQCFSSSKTSLSSHESDCLDSQESESTWQKESLSICVQPDVINTSVHKISTPHSGGHNSFESPNVKIVSYTDSLMTQTPAQSAPERLMTQTPAQSAPERLLPGSDVKLQNMTAQKSASCFKPAKRVLDFALMEEDDDLDNRVDVLESSKALREGCKYFDSVSLSPEGIDIPEAALQERFSQRACNLIFEDELVNSSTELSSTSNQIEPLLNKSHLCPSFRSHFFQKNVANQTEQVQCFSSSKTSLSSHESDCLDSQKSESTWLKGCTPLSDCLTNPNAERGKQNESLSVCVQPDVINTSVHNSISPPHSVSRSSIESPDMKIVSCTDSLMTQTPAQSAAPGILLPCSDVKLQSMTAEKSTSRFKPAKRVLDFSFTEGNDCLDNRVDVLESSKALREFDCISKLSRGFSEDPKSFDSVSLEVPVNIGYSLEKTNQNQTGLDALDNNISSLVELVNVIDYIFRSVQRTPITKEELLQKIMMNCLDFVEIREAEEQIEILEKLLPDWICKKLVCSGDTMYCVKNALDFDSVRSRLLSNVTEGVE
ncbi:uncharacterized protein [Cicer arietinum]|uniref:CDT1-like protein b n=1 Tax=Cicer arietinum TaxID=3827 RepID=A0A1S2Z0E1_CICAR|nr:CDT1-like protein b [Cicer arietinum]XP_004512800.1 CDT1-like protein b [Cicer arietinum]